MTSPGPSWRRNSVGFIGALAVALLGACTKNNPDYCVNKDDLCPEGKRCNAETHTCELASEMPDADAPDAALDSIAVKIDGTDGASSDRAIDATSDQRSDRPVVDAVGSCANDGHCSGDKPTCVAGICGKCATNKDCADHPGANVCDPSGRCVQCTSTAGCDPASSRSVCLMNVCSACNLMADSCKTYPTTPLCELGSGRCVECLQANSSECTTPAKPICSANKCTACGDDAACANKNGATPACEKSSGSCVECTEDRHCASGARPVCDKTQKKCIPCTSDTQCAAKNIGPGVCMFHQDGHCATDAEAIYVQYQDSCASNPTQNGSATAPFCTLQAGVNAATGAKKLVVIRGPQSLGECNVSVAAGQLTVVGQSAATIRSGGSNPGIHLLAGDLYLRGVAVSNGGGVGILADSGSTLRVNRCTVKNNDRGGIQVSDGAAFEITNSIIAENSLSGLIGGATLGAVPAGRPHKFQNNTVVGNKNAAGVICKGTAQPIQASILYGNTGLQNSDCVVEVCCSGDPMLSPTQRLTAGSPCIDKSPAPMSTLDDIDGDARPKGNASDCGADEL